MIISNPFQEIIFLNKKKIIPAFASTPTPKYTIYTLFGKKLHNLLIYSSSHNNTNKQEWFFIKTIKSTIFGKIYIKNCGQHL